MGKGSELWDDSALIDAFDNAMTTYKAMHSKTYNEDSHEEEKHTRRSNEHEPSFTEKTNGVHRHVELEVNDNNISSSVTEMFVPCHDHEAASGILPVQENNAPESLTQPSEFPVIDGKVDSFSEQRIVDYNQLLGQYYELEEQKQKIAQQLQASYWNYEPTVHSASQAIQVPALDASGNCPQLACSECSCHCLTAPLIPACAIGGPSSGGYCCYSGLTACCSASHVQQCPSGHQYPAEMGTCSRATSCKVNPMPQCIPAHDNVDKTGMMAAERAISCMQKEISAISSSGEERVEGKDRGDGSGMCGGEGSMSISSETDLSAVLSAWYAAGFHTGRYLMEQQAKKNTSE